MNYRVRKLRLVNFHNFEDETLEVEGSLFLIGDNLSGKTTLLDAVHFALTAGVELEFNAAARMGGRASPGPAGAGGRTLQSILLRVDNDRGGAARRANGAVGYAALEVVDNGGRVLSFGAGAFAASLESRPEVWGFVAARPLSEVPLVVTVGENGSAERRPADRAELEAALGRGSVFDLGRYRTEIGTRLFGDRERFEQVAGFIAAGKAYRELVRRSGAFGEVFAELLPPPDAEALVEIRGALRKLEETRTNLDALEHELSLLRGLVDLLRQVDAAREAQARYDYVAARWSTLRAEEEREARGEALARRASEGREGEDARAEAERRVQALDAELRELRATDAARLVYDREQRAWDLATWEREAEARKERAVALAARAEADGEEAASAVRAREGAREQMASAVALVRPVAVEMSGEAGASALDRAASGLDAAEESPLRDARDAVLDALSGAADGLRAERARLDGEDREASSREEALDAEIAELQSRGELEPLAGLHRAFDALAREGLKAEPVYRLLDLAEGVEAPLAGRIEEVLGPEVLGAVVPLADAERVRARVLELAPGIPVVDAARLDDVAPPPGSLVELLRPDRASGDAAIAFAKLRAGEVRIGEGDAKVPRLSDDGVLYRGRAHVRLEGGPARFLGARSRALAVREKVAELSRDLDAVRQRRIASAAAVELMNDDLRRAEGARRAFERDFDVPGLLHAAREVERAREVVHRSALAAEEARDGAAQAESQRERLRAVVAGLDRAIDEAGARGLHGRLAHLEAELARAREDEKAATGRASGAQALLREAEEAHRAALEAAETARAELSERRERLVRLLEAAAAQDVDEYVFRTKRGDQIRPQNLAEHRQQASRDEGAAVAALSGKGGIEDPLLWKKHAFRYEAAENRLVDSRDRPVEEVVRACDAEVAELRTALRGRSEELLERIVLEDLVGSLRREVTSLDRTLRGVNRLVADLRFGRSQYKFEAPLKAEYRRLHELLMRGTLLDPAARDELKSYFQSRLDELEGDPDEVPAVLDYRRWFDFRIRVFAGTGTPSAALGREADGEGVELTPRVLGAGSTGEQAVPNYLLLLCLTKLLYDRVDAKVRLLLLDEGFYGVDAGRRDELIRFAARAGLQLVVASPDLDGLRDGVESSTTMLVEKSAEGDVFLSRIAFREPEGTLFDRAEIDPATAVLRIGADGAAA